MIAPQCRSLIVRGGLGLVNGVIAQQTSSRQRDERVVAALTLAGSCERDRSLIRVSQDLGNARLSSLSLHLDGRSPRIDKPEQHVT